MLDRSFACICALVLFALVAGCVQVDDPCFPDHARRWAQLMRLTPTSIVCSEHRATVVQCDMRTLEIPAVVSLVCTIDRCRQGAL